MVDVVFVVLLLLHVGSIVAWMGGAVLFVSVISPSLRKMSPPSRSEFILSALPPYLRFIGGSSVLSVLAGLALYFYVSQPGSANALSSSGQTYIQAGAVVALIIIIIAFGVAIPSGRKLISLLKETQKPPDPTVMASLQRRLNLGARLGVVLLAVTLIMMVVGANI